MPNRILLADDHAIVRQGLRALLEREGYTVVAEAGDGQEALREARERCPDVAVLDFSMPLLNGLDAAREILKVCPRARAILLTMHTDDHYVLEAVRAGIKGYVVKTQASADLVRAIHEVLRGMMYLSPGISQAVVEAYLAKSEMPPDPLTSREREVLQLVAEGKSTKEIAKLLGISFKTAESHRTRIMKKTNIQAGGLVDVGFLHDPGPVGLCGLEADPQELGDLFRGLALRDQLEDLALPSRQRVARHLRLGQVRLDDGLGDSGAQVHHASQHLVDRPHQIARGLSLDDVALDARLERLQDVVVVRVHRQENGLGAGTGAEDLPGRAEPVQERHREI